MNEMTNYKPIAIDDTNADYISDFDRETEKYLKGTK